MKIKNDRCFIIGVILAAIVLIALPFIFKKISNYQHSKQIEQNAAEYFKNYNDPYLDGISGVMVGNKTIDYRYKPKNEHAYLQLKQHSEVFSQRVIFETCMQLANPIHKGINIQYSYYYNDTSDTNLATDDPSLRFLQIIVSKDVCAKLSPQ